MSRLGFGVVGTGFIAGVVADALARASNAKLTAASSRRRETAEAFVASRPWVAPVEGVDALLARDDVEAVYVATPTVAKEPIALKAIAAGKHVLVDKPYMDRASAARMIEAAAAQGVLFMDATHFVHNPRTAAVQAAVPALIGEARSLHTAFYFPFGDPDNIRFDPSQEPTTALGDMAWYSMRAVVEYLQPTGPIARLAITTEKYPATGSIVRASGLIVFEDGRSTTFDVGYTAGTIVMDLQLIGTSGVIGMDDFVLDWTNSFAFKNPEIPAGYTHRTGMATRKDATFVPTPVGEPQEVAMVQDFAAKVAAGKPFKTSPGSQATLRTQEYLDALWEAAK